ncbi:MAG: alanine racemase C-terminal domain-containing protein, partial [Elusimicrobiota bacterium]|nr:alanine racemase C-terminal domain-containing protein [Elusimicrobiota bacterium]
GEVLIRGRRFPIAGRVCMDMTMIDVTDLPSVGIGDEAVFMGGQGKEEISASQIADLAGTINYEICCGISSRVPRVYTNL